MNLSKSTYSLLVLFILHAVGVYLFMNDPANAALSYVTLIITGIILLLNEEKLKGLLLPFIAIFIGGYAIELIGTKTGYLFGNYQYGSSLGFKIAGVPLVIGLNWLIAVRSSIEISKLISQNKWMVSVLSGILCVLLDMLIEPVAIAYDFWSWQGHIPIFNYVCWFIFSFLFALLIQKYPTSNNKLGISIFTIWVLFFSIILYL